jgi:hypothetical protein
LADGLNSAHAAATQTTILLKIFESLTVFASKNQYGVTLDQDGWSFRVKDWKIILPQLVIII